MKLWIEECDVRKNVVYKGRFDQIREQGCTRLLPALPPSTPSNLGEINHRQLFAVLVDQEVELVEVAVDQPLGRQSADQLHAGEVHLAV